MLRCCVTVDTMLWNKYLFYTYIFISQSYWHVFGTLTKLSLRPTFHNVIGTLWARFVGHFETYFYLFISLSHFVRGICFAEVKHKISQWNVVGITFDPVICFLSKACPYIVYADFPILQKGCHNMVNIVALFPNESCHNVVEMLSYNILRQRCGNFFLDFPGICCSYVYLIFPTFSQLSSNVLDTLLQPYIVVVVYLGKYII